MSEWFTGTSATSLVCSYKSRSAILEQHSAFSCCSRSIKKSHSILLHCRMFSLSLATSDNCWSCPSKVLILRWSYPFSRSLLSTTLWSVLTISWRSFNPAVKPSPFNRNSSALSFESLKSFLAPFKLVFNSCSCECLIYAIDSVFSNFWLIFMFYCCNFSTSHRVYSSDLNISWSRDAPYFRFCFACYISVSRVAYYFL